MKQCIRWGLTLAALALWTLGASELTDYAPPSSGIVALVNLKKIIDSRCVRDFLPETPESQKKRELLDAEICIFADAPDLEHCRSFYVLALHHAGKAGLIFDECVQMFTPAEVVGKKGEMRIARDQNRVLMQRDEKMVQFSSWEDPAEVSLAPLEKNHLPLAGEIDPDAMIGIAVDLEKIKLLDELQNGETWGKLLKDVVKMTFHLAERDDALVLTSVGVYRDISSAAEAKKAADNLSGMPQEALRAPSRQHDCATSLMQRLSVNDRTTLDGVRLVGVTVIDRTLLQELIDAAYRQSQTAQQP